MGPGRDSPSLRGEARSNPKPSAFAADTEKGANPGGANSLPNPKIRCQSRHPCASADRLPASIPCRSGGAADSSPQLPLRQFGYPSPFREQVGGVRRPLPCFPPMALSSRRLPPSRGSRPSALTRCSCYVDGLGPLRFGRRPFSRLCPLRDPTEPMRPSHSRSPQCCPRPQARRRHRQGRTLRG